MEWPSRFLNLKPIENLWAVPIRIVYSNFCQFDDIDSFKEAILHPSDSIELIELKALVHSMERRSISMTEKRGVILGTETIGRSCVSAKMTTLPILFHTK